MAIIPDRQAFQFEIAIDESQARRLDMFLGQTPARLKAATRGAINDTGKHGTGLIIKRISDRVMIRQRELKRDITWRSPRGEELVGVIRVEKKRRIPLIAFGARQTRRGVSYQISRTEGRKTIPRGFITTVYGSDNKALLRKLGAQAAGLEGDSTSQYSRRLKAGFGGHTGVFQRRTSARLPIDEMLGLSAWGAYVKSGMAEPTENEIREYLVKATNDRIRVELLRQGGMIPEGRAA